jgi:MFS family permease
LRTPARRAAQSALLGSTVEYYDFTLYATASALFLGQVFFKPLGPGAATLASFVTFGLAFVARPAGAIVFGHVGDRIGRRTALVGSVTLMGVSTTAIGLLPGYATWGAAAPALLVFLRLLQGFSAGAEQAGSNALTLEHAPEGQRARYAAWTMQGTALGTLAGKLAFIVVVGFPPDMLLSWGWRLPFLAAAPLLAVALWIRTRAEEAPAFAAQLAAGPARAPLAEVWRHHRRAVVVVAGGTLLMIGGAALNVFGLSVATKIGGLPERTFLILLALATALELVCQPLWARLADRIGRRPILLGALVAETALFFVYVPALVLGHLGAIAATALAMAVAWSAAASVSAAFFCEQFPTRVRYTGAAFASQLGMIAVGFTPMLMMTAMGADGGAWLRACLVAAGILVLAALSCLATRETAQSTLAELDAPPTTQSGTALGDR